LDDAIVSPDRGDHGVGRWRTPDSRLGVRRVAELGLFDEPIVGVLGGMGPSATAAFYEHLIAMTDASCDQEHLHVVIDSFSQIPDRTDFLLGKGEDPRPAMLNGLERLRAAGCAFAVIPCNTANVFRVELAEKVGLEVVDWIGLATAAATDRGYTRIGLFATNGTLSSGVYQMALADAGAIAISPNPREQSAVMNAIYGLHGVKAGHRTGSARDDLGLVAANLVRRGAQRLLLACTELPLVAPEADSIWEGMAVDPSIVVARAVIQMTSQWKSRSRP
jgi:aspartate racemase